MTVSRDGGVVRLVGLCRVEDAEPLTALLQGVPDSAVDLSACEGLHAAVLQTILAFRPAIVGSPENTFLKDYLLPAIASERQSGKPKL
jgi:hypothetical protein